MKRRVLFELFGVGLDVHFQSASNFLISTVKHVIMTGKRQTLFALVAKNKVDTQDGAYAKDWRL